MTTTFKTLANYGPRQFGERIGFPEWQFERALRLELIPAADTSGRWTAAVFNEVVSRLDSIRTAVGNVSDVGATRAEEHLAQQFGITVNPGTAAELSRRGHLPTRGQYKGHTLYCGLTLEHFTDRRKVTRASAAGHLHTRDEAATILRLRAADFDHLLRAGLLTHSETTVSTWHKGTIVRLYRQADLDRVTRSSRIDWDAVRTTPRGRQSPLAQLPSRPGSQARS
ncbi:hypothetical protein ACEZDB_32195 [Streptacidiphilus sp. N1-3]|uniref:Uncharacterized protein n=1 Tax=Streptacidiphilus alkalitolerans TaxID=3342712 RepID=A0ABV6XAN9_9ACTN